jgi:glycosyltransferase involved in cell wall biosynthesis
VSGRIIHVAEIEISPETGMGRIAWHWKQAFEGCGYEFVHIGPSEVGKLWHRTLFPRAAYSAYQRSGKRGDIFLVHEPASGAFVKRGVPAFVFSHGIEWRGMQIMAGYSEKPSMTKRFQSAMTAPLWRSRSYSCEKGLRNATAVLLSNQDDLAFACRYYGLTNNRGFVFHNGVNLDDSRPSSSVQERCILFLGSWLKRKGTEALAKAAFLLDRRGVVIQWILAGTGLDRPGVLADWPANLKSVTTVIPRFSVSEEAKILARCVIFVLPSLFEGQPLALLQAMAGGKCCIASNCCGQKDLLQHGVNGLLHEPNDAQGLAALIQQAIENPELASRLGQNAARSVASQSWEAVSAEVISYVKSVIRKGR